ncbi:MAG: hypothetical protein OEQ39_05705 [Gammaproteobacteria bacterium]|nr:hypothetical protein [Gammaproteobacteria bacterium]
MAAATAPLVFTDGFDHLTQPQSDQGKWTDFGSGWFVTGASTRSGSGQNAQVTSTGAPMSKHFVSAGYRAAVVGFAFKFNNASIDHTNLMTLESVENADVCMSLRKTSTDLLALYSGTTAETLLATGTTTLLNDTWYYIEVYYYIDNASGRYQLWLDGVSEIALASSQDTQIAASNSFDRVYFRGGAYTQSMDDVYIRAKTTDVTTPADEVFGDVNIRTVYPDANGTNRDFTLSTGTDDFAVVDEAIASETDYAYSSTAAHKVTMSTSNLSSGRTIYAVVLNTWVGMDTAGSQNIKHVVRSGTTDYASSSTFALSETARNEQTFYELNPDTAAAWTETNFNSAEFGIEVQ